MGRFIAVLSIFMVLLAACGEPNIGTPSSSTGSQAAQATEQPSPEALTPEPATDIPSPSVASPVPEPTVADTQTPLVVSPTVAATSTPLMATKIDSFPFAKKEKPSVLIGWSPDDQYFLYAQYAHVDPTTDLFLGRAWILDLASREPQLITQDNIVISIADNGETYNGNLPSWTETCCEIAVSLVDNGQQHVQIIDRDGKMMKELKTLKPSLIKYHNKQLIRVEQGKLFTDDTLLNESLISTSGSLTRTQLTNEGVFTHTRTDVQYLGLDKTEWVIKGDETFLKGKPDYNIFRMEVTSDGRWVALTTEKFGSWKRELWIIDRETNTYRLIKAADKLSYPGWSADATYLAYQENGSLEVFDRTTGQTIQLGSSFDDVVVWHPSRPLLAATNETSLSIDVFTLSH